MSLVKKTVVLSDRTPKGYVTIVRVGNETGVKIVGETFEKGMKCFIKAGRETANILLDGKRTEREVDLLPDSETPVGCVVYDEGVVAKGGKLSDGEIASAIKKEEKEEERPVEEEGTEQTVQPSEPDEEKKDEPEGEIAPKGSMEQQEEGTIENEKVEPVTEEEEMLRRLGQGEKDFYVGISDRVDELFVVYPSEENLSRAIPDSEWVKVKYDGEEYYVVGRLSEEGKIKYLGYGVPGFENLKPPKVTNGIANWFPLPRLKKYEGYWLFFQDADTGKISD